MKSDKKYPKECFFPFLKFHPLIHDRYDFIYRSKAEVKKLNEELMTKSNNNFIYLNIHNRLPEDSLTSKLCCQEITGKFD